MKRERFFELLRSPYFPYIAVELIYIVISIIFNFKLRYLNERLYQNFDIDRMVLQKNVVIATDIMRFENNTSYEFLIGGILLIIIVISISKALFSPIIIATLILCAAGSAFAIGGSSQT